ncbi:MAG: hypothetical protein ACRDYX_05420 [Egibacteraceae bacterium]
MAVQVQLVLWVEARDADEATAVIDDVVDALNHPVIERIPVEAYKDPGLWQAVTDLAYVDADLVPAVTELSARLAPTGWDIEDLDSEARAFWERGDASDGADAAAFVHPAVQAAYLEAFPPLEDQEPAETEELVPQGPETELSADEWAELLRDLRDIADRDTR